MATDSKSRFKAKIKPPRFSWLSDPADALRGSTTAIRTPDQMQRMLDYNKQLVEPMDRGGGAMIRQNGQPERFSGLRPSETTGAPPVRAGFETPNAGDFARIVDKYGAGNPGTVLRPVNPNLVTGAIPPAAPVQPSAPAALGPTGAPGESGDANSEPQAGAWNHNAPIPGNPNLTNPAQPVANPNDFLHSLADGPDAPTGGITPPFSTLQDGPLTNVNTGAPVARGDLAGDPKPPVDDEKTRQADFLSKGGSLAQFHQSEVAKGLRPPIDARTRPDPLGSTASADIRNSMGFGGTPQETASNVANQMTDEFNTNHAVQQKEWRQKFDDAHANLMKSLQQDH